VAIAMGMTVMAPGERLVGEPVEMVASRKPNAEEMDASERVLGMQLRETPPSSPGKITWKRLGESWIPC
jgi:hypothetical protein